MYKHVDSIAKYKIDESDDLEPVRNRYGRVKAEHFWNIPEKEYDPKKRIDNGKKKVSGKEQYGSNTAPSSQLLPHVLWCTHMNKECHEKSFLPSSTLLDPIP